MITRSSEKKAVDRASMLEISLLHRIFGGWVRHSTHSKLVSTVSPTPWPGRLVTNPVLVRLTGVEGRGRPRTRAALCRRQDDAPMAEMAARRPQSIVSAAGTKRVASWRWLRPQPKTSRSTERIAEFDHVLMLTSRPARRERAGRRLKLLRLDPALASQGTCGDRGEHDRREAYEEGSDRMRCRAVQIGTDWGVRKGKRPSDRCC